MAVSYTHLDVYKRQMQAIADELGMDMQVEDMQFDAIIAAVSSGKVDVLSLIHI